MKHKTFFWFFLPTGLAMLMFIAFPIVSVVTQSLFTPHDAVLITVENCGPFGCKKETTIDEYEINAEILPVALNSGLCWPKHTLVMMVAILGILQ